MCEVVSRQVNYLIDEASDGCKGANMDSVKLAVIYMPTIVQARIQTTVFFGTWHGELFINFMPITQGWS